MLYLTCNIIPYEDIVCYLVSRTKDQVSGDSSTFFTFISASDQRIESELEH